MMSCGIIRSGRRGEFFFFFSYCFLDQGDGRWRLQGGRVLLSVKVTLTDDEIEK
jgi:hypothetical protein